MSLPPLSQQHKGCPGRGLHEAIVQHQQQDSEDTDGEAEAATSSLLHRHQRTDQQEQAASSLYILKHRGLRNVQLIILYILVYILFSLRYAIK